jgi:integrase
MNGEGWLFPSPITGKPFHAAGIVRSYLRPAALRLKFGDGVGWHCFRHPYRALLNDTGAPVGVQQRLMRHANVSTTMNFYGSAYLETKRRVNSAMVSRIKPALQLL